MIVEAKVDDCTVVSSATDGRFDAVVDRVVSFSLVIEREEPKRKESRRAFYALLKSLS
jgi:hypothetical protein